MYSDENDVYGVTLRLYPQAEKYARPAFFQNMASSLQFLKVSDANLGSFSKQNKNEK